MKRNTERLQQVMTQITDNPDLHDPRTWVDIQECGTVACFAGRAGLLSGMTVRQILNAEMYKKGAELLGLSGYEAHILFDCTNTRPMLELMVKDLVNGDALQDSDFYFGQTRLQE